MPKLPEVNELVLTKVKKILPYGAFCILEEYGNYEAFLHISEVAPRWIKNIHEFLHEGQRLVCKVHRVVPEKGQVDISLKRVSEADKKRKLNIARQEKRSKKLFEVALKQAKSTTQEGMDAKQKLEEEFGTLIDAFESISEEGDEAVKELKIEKGLAKALVATAKKSIKKSKATIRQVVQIASYSPKGVEVVKKALGGVKAPEECELNLHYLGAPRYQITIVAKDFKQGQKAIDKIKKNLEQKAKKEEFLLEFEEAGT
ncbi:MAG: S1 RNA-binding domain-containing protein [Candidatus Micrarchaeota archaeon]